MALRSLFCARFVSSFSPARNSLSRRRTARSSTELALEVLEPRCLLTTSGYSPIDGIGNNLSNTLLGSAGTDLKRMVPAAYADGISAPIEATRPSARLISNVLSSQSSEILDSRNVSAMIYAWGQFIDHDMDLTTQTNISLPIAVPSGDPSFDPAGTGTQTLPFTRSVTDPSTGPSSGTPLQQINEITSFLDGSMIYGSDPTRALALRTMSGGKLKTSAGDLLPLNTGLLPNANDAQIVPDDQLFLAGDIRANENIDETVLQTLFVREHNRIADQIAAANPRLTDQQIYLQARQIVIGEIQAITYNEFLPALLGAGSLAPYTGYNANVDPSISTEFSTAAFRIGHSQVGPDVEFLDTNGNRIRAPLNLDQAFFDPRIIEQYGIDPVLKYLTSDVAQAVDPQAVDELRNFLFGPPGSPAGGQDLISLDIQRGRDHGLADYNTTRVAFGLPAVTSFAQITSDPQVVAGLRQLYGQTNGVDNVNNIDLFVGLVAEDHLPGSSVGPLTQKIMVDQFIRLRDGDRFFYKNVFSGSQLRQIDNTTLADVIRRNTTDTNLQDNVFYFATSISGQVWLTQGILSGKPCGGPGGRVAPAAGVTVSLYDSTGTLVATTTTDNRGSYKFSALDLGTYTVKATIVGGNGTNYSRAVDLTRGIAMTGIDLGFKIDLGGRYQGLGGLGGQGPGGLLAHGWDSGWFPW